MTTPQNISRKAVRDFMAGALAEEAYWSYGSWLRRGARPIVRKSSGRLCHKPPSPQSLVAFRRRESNDRRRSGATIGAETGGRSCKVTCRLCNKNGVFRLKRALFRRSSRAEPLSGTARALLEYRDEFQSSLGRVARAGFGAQFSTQPDPRG